MLASCEHANVSIIVSSAVLLFSLAVFFLVIAHQKSFIEEGNEPRQLNVCLAS